jgi:two-component system chemotaxis response regulator CheY
MEVSMKNILVVDDAMFMRTVLKNVLIAGGYKIVGEAENGLEAVEKYKLLKPDIVTMDITMPEMDGLQATSEILKHDKQANICMVTAMGQQQMILEAVKRGAKDFIVKPFNADEILAKMEKITT